MNNYQVLLAPFLLLFDDLIIKGKSPKKAIENYIKWKVKRYDRHQSDIIIWTWKKRLWFNIIKW